MKNLTDEPGDLRKVHSKHIPTLGGVIIFAGTLFSLTLLLPTIAARQHISQRHSGIGCQLFAGCIADHIFYRDKR